MRGTRTHPSPSRLRRRFAPLRGIQHSAALCLLLSGPATHPAACRGSAALPVLSSVSLVSLDLVWSGMGPAGGMGRRRFRTSRRFSRRGRCRQEATSRVPRRWRRWGALCHPDRRALCPGALCHHVQPGNLRRARGCGYHGLQSSEFRVYSIRPRGYTWHRLAPASWGCLFTQRIVLSSSSQATRNTTNLLCRPALPTTDRCWWVLVGSGALVGSGGFWWVLVGYPVWYV